MSPEQEQFWKWLGIILVLFTGVMALEGIILVLMQAIRNQDPRFDGVDRRRRMTPRR